MTRSRIPRTTSRLQPLQRQGSFNKGGKKAVAKAPKASPAPPPPDGRQRSAPAAIRASHALGYSISSTYPEYPDVF